MSASPWQIDEFGMQAYVTLSLNLVEAPMHADDGRALSGPAGAQQQTQFTPACAAATFRRSRPENEAAGVDAQPL